MFSFDTKQLEMDASKNLVITKKVELQKNLDVMMVLSSSNKKIVPVILNQIIDLIMDHVDEKNVYNSFSVTLENINFFLKSLKRQEEQDLELSIIIGILEKNALHFAKIGTSSAFLINKENDCIEITAQDTPETFDFISSGMLGKNEKVIFSNLSLPSFVTQSDFEEIGTLDSIEKVNKNILDIANEEKIETNLGLLTLEFEEALETSKKIPTEKIKYVFFKIFDNHLTKELLARVMILKEKIEVKGKVVKNIAFFGGIFISALLLFKIISSTLGSGVNSASTEDYKLKLIQSKEYFELANQNFSNPEAFNFNIENAEKLVNEVKEKQLFLNDVESIQNDISLAKKQFNGIETFETTASNMIFKGDFKDGVKILELNKKIYVLGKSALYGPVNPGGEIQTHIFQDLNIEDEFLDAAISNENIIIHTRKGRMVRFGKDQKFEYINVLEQQNWETSRFVESYNGNLYVTNKEGNQIFMHSPALNSFNTGIPYLNNEDSKTLENILAVGVDGGIYMLKNDLKLYKFFRSPKYRLESIVLNKLPKNYAIENNNTNIKIVTKPTLNYVYFYLNNKIWIFKPNTRLFADVKSLEYVGQIEGKNEAFISFDIPRDGEIQVLTKSGIYKINFEQKDSGIILR